MRTWLICAIVALIAAPADAGVRRVWAVNDGEKVERDAPNHPASARNSTWEGRTIHVFGARNEIIAFQVIVEADERGVRELLLRLPSLVSDHDRITYQPPAADPTDSVGRPIQIFAANYMLVTTPSHGPLSGRSLRPRSNNRRRRSRLRSGVSKTGDQEMRRSRDLSF